MFGRHEGWTEEPQRKGGNFSPMNPKKRPNHQRYLEVLKGLTPEQRLRKAFDLSDFSRALFVHGLRKRFPDIPEGDFRKLLLARLNKCHNRNY